ncbi:hypothetical protein C8R44DRAFT_984868 [Mycena epipterygia]|nr:hypothetical protein C8R44DRAFT_984868 [Mycena epipterygia]
MKKQAMLLLGGDRGLKMQELEISFSTADKNSESKRGALTTDLIKRVLSGNLHSWNDCLGEPLIKALSSLKELEYFHHKAMTATRRTLDCAIMRLVSAWPKLRLYLTGNTDRDEDLTQIPPVTCALEDVTFERCMSNFDEMAPIFAGSTHSLRSSEDGRWGTRRLSTAPRLASIQLGGNTDDDGALRRAFAAALDDGADADAGAGFDAEQNTNPKSKAFPALRRLAYPAQDGTYKTGRRRSARTHEPENEGESTLLKAEG